MHKTFLLVAAPGPRERGGANNAVTFASFYEDVARQRQCSRIETRSVQMPAVDYAVEKVGWQIREIVFGKDLGVNDGR